MSDIRRRLDRIEEQLGVNERMYALVDADGYRIVYPEHLTGRVDELPEDAVIIKIVYGVSAEDL